MVGRGLSMQVGDTGGVKKAMMLGGPLMDEEALSLLTGPYAATGSANRAMLV